MLEKLNIDWWHMQYKEYWKRISLNGEFISRYFIDTWISIVSMHPEISDTKWHSELSVIIKTLVFSSPWKVFSQDNNILQIKKSHIQILDPRLEKKNIEAAIYFAKSTYKGKHCRPKICYDIFLPRSN